MKIMRWWNVPRSPDEPQRHIYLRRVWRLTATEGKGEPWHKEFDDEDAAKAYAAAMRARAGGEWQALR